MKEEVSIESTGHQVILYDDQCFLCRSLAAFAVKRYPKQITAHPLSEDLQSDDSARQLQIQDGEKLLTGTEAWEHLLATYPDLKALNWIASKLNLHRQTATALEYAGRAARMICFSCGASENRRRRRNQ